MFSIFPQPCRGLTQKSRRVGFANSTMAKLHVGLDGVEHVSIPKYKLHFSFNFHHIQHAISLLLKPRHVQFPSNPTCNFIFFQNLRCPISSKSDSDRHAIWFGLESGCAQFPSNPTYIFTFFSNTICPIPSKHVLQFRFFRDPDMINSHQIRHTMSSFFDIHMPNLHKTRHAISLFWECGNVQFPVNQLQFRFFLQSEHAQFPANPTFHFAFLESGQPDMQCRIHQWCVVLASSSKFAIFHVLIGSPV